MIPKKIHYCWFGRGEKPELARKCIASWRKFCPDYQIIEWNEDNFDLNCNAYVRYCYANKKWAFLSDFVRLAVVNEHGGLYFDTDVEMVAPPDGLLEYDAFYGFENDTSVNTGQGFGSVAHHPTVEVMIDQYLNLSQDEQGLYPVLACPELNTNALLPLGLVLNGQRQNVAGAEILPSDFTNPYDDATGRLNKTANTISIHWYSKSWMTKEMRLRSALTRPFHRIFGVDCFRWLKKK